MYWLTSSVMSPWICISLTSGMSPKTYMYCYPEYFLQFTRAQNCVAYSYTCICLFLKKWWKEERGIPQKMGKTTYWETERIGQYVYFNSTKWNYFKSVSFKCCLYGIYTVVTSVSQQLGMLYIKKLLTHSLLGLLRTTTPQFPGNFR